MDIRKWVGRPEAWIFLVVLLAAPLLALFLKIASEVSEGDSLALDRWLLLHLRHPDDTLVPIGPQWLRSAMIDITALGGGTVLTLVTLFACGYLVARSKPALALLVGVSVGVGAILNTILKNGFVRERPDVVPHLVEVTSASFPSGHAMNSATVYLTLAALLVTAERNWRVRIFLAVAALLLVFLVGISRVYLGVHWPTDVLAGWSVGTAWAVLSALIAVRLQRARTVEGAEPVSSDPA